MIYLNESDSVVQSTTHIRVKAPLIAILEVILLGVLGPKPHSSSGFFRIAVLPPEPLPPSRHGLGL